jgi:hypothetical protein
VYGLAGTLRRLATARVWHAPVLMANLIYWRRMQAQGNLVPEGEDFAGMQPDLDAPRPAVARQPVC